MENPCTYWKVAILQKPQGRIAVAAFLKGQLQYVSALYEAKVFTNLNPYTPKQLREDKIQITLKSLQETIGRSSGLDFSPLYDYDSQAGLESTEQINWLRSLDDIVI